MINISVVIPMFNSKDTIIGTLDSVKNQSAAQHILEVIVVNDGSTDSSLDFVKDYSRNHSELNISIIDKPNGGVSTARNAGMKAAKGDWIALLDSDDCWFADKTELQVKTVTEHPEIDFLGGNMDDKILKILWKKIDGLYKANVKDICLKMFPQTSTAIFKKTIFEEIGGYDESQRYAEDGNYFLKICSRFNYYHLPVQMVIYGGGKQGFGVSGLSANLKGMHEGNLKNIAELKGNSAIGMSFYIFLRFFYWLKYMRRLLIVYCQV